MDSDVQSTPALSFVSVVLPAALGLSLLVGVGGAAYVATIDKEFRASYGRIVDSLVTGTLGAVVGGGSVAVATQVASRKRKQEALKATTGARRGRPKGSTNKPSIPPPVVPPVQTK
jgi:hypothetical protein